jgi:hypothetical protein
MDMDDRELESLVQMGGPDKPNGVPTADWNVARNVLEARRRSRSGTAARADDQFVAIVKLGVFGVLIAGAFLLFRSSMIKLANRSVLASLFPRAGDDLARYAISVLTLWAFLPGALVALSAMVRGGRLDRLRRILRPLIVALVVAIPLMTTATTTAVVLRLYS